MSNQISRGYFAIGVEGLSKPMNFGNLVRSAHAFGASFFFTVGKSVPKHLAPKSDTSRSTRTYSVLSLGLSFGNATSK